MARKKSKKNKVAKIKWSESYTSLFLGIIVVVIVVVLIVSFVKNNNQMNLTDSSSTTADGLVEKPTTYTVKENDNLWKISEEMYGTGYNWVDIVSANKISNPNVLFVGVELTIPDVEPIVVDEPKITQVVIQEDEYIVQKGDSLWDIALRAYGDGYKWTELASVNNLTNPDVIHAGNVIKIPR